MPLNVLARRTLLIAVGLLLLINGCGYLPATPSVSRAGAPVQRIVIPVFVNDTFEPALEGKVTRMVKQEFLTRPGYRVIQDPSQAHLILEGRITTFSLTPLSFNQDFQVAEYRVRITMNVKVLHAQDRKPLWQQGGIKATAEYVVSPDPDVSRSAEDLAIDEAAKRMAEEIWIGVSRLTS
ncbi:MAG: LPS assembly lipoprotein LptE, partial [Nitrospiria bacterium]